MRGVRVIFSVDRYSHLRDSLTIVPPTMDPSNAKVVDSPTYNDLTKEDPTLTHVSVSKHVPASLVVDLALIVEPFALVVEPLALVVEPLSPAIKPFALVVESPTLAVELFAPIVELPAPIVELFTPAVESPSQVFEFHAYMVYFLDCSSYLYYLQLFVKS